MYQRLDLFYQLLKILLKEEYQNLTGKEIGQLRKSGVEISQKTEVNFVFLGDTNISIFNNPDVLKTPVILSNALFLMIMFHQKKLLKEVIFIGTN